MYLHVCMYMFMLDFQYGETGDVLYIPPYVWHHVASVDTSVSVTSLSHDRVLRNHLESVYRFDHKFDILTNSSG
jgi:ribosomal protein L16 Arg81 hydroxylase